MGRPRFSIIIPVYNVENYLIECLESVIRQPEHDFEVVCVNDGSTDKSVDILADYESRDRRVKVIHQANQGLAAARNAGIRFAEGKYVCFLDSDDKLSEGSLGRLCQVLDEEEYDFICYDVRLQYEKPELESRANETTYFKKKKRYGVSTGRLLFEEMIANDDFCNNAWTLCINLDWMNENHIRFYPGILFEDILFTFLCFMRAKRAAHSAHENYIYRIRENSIMTSKASIDKARSYAVNYQEIMKFMLNEEMDPGLQDAVARYAKQITERLRFMCLAVSDALMEAESEVGFSVGERFVLSAAWSGIQPAYPYNLQMYLKGFLRTLMNEDAIIIYGAGKVGRRVYGFLKEQGLEEKVICYALSGKPSQDDMMGVPVKCIYELPTGQGALVLISSVNTANQEEMARILEGLGHKRWLAVDTQMWYLISG